MRLDDPVDDLLPELADMTVLADPRGPLEDTVPANRLITLRDPGEPVVEDAPDGWWSRPPAFESGGGGLVSTADDFLAFASALLAGGSHRGERVLSRPSVTLMTSDHLTAAQKATSGFWPGYFEAIGRGFGMSVRTPSHAPRSLGRKLRMAGTVRYRLVQRSGREHDHDRHAAAGARGRPAAADVERHLDHRLPGDRRLTAP